MKRVFGILTGSGRSLRTASLLSLLMAATLSLVGAALSHGFFHAAAMSPRISLAHSMPEGALLYIESKDFGQLMADWNKSPEKQVWVGSDNYSVFSKSRLFLRLQDAQKGFAAAAGLPPDSKFLSEVAGEQSALAVYDVGNLEFLYISRVPSAQAMQSMLWQTRNKFEARDAGGKQFFVRKDKDSNRTVAFAVAGDYLILATREDLAADALDLIGGGSGQSIEQEEWFSKAVAAAPQAGDLRMVMHLEAIAVEPHFRTYWLPQNITETSGYIAGVSDLYRAADRYREERVLLRKSPEELAKTVKAKPSASALPRPHMPFTAEGARAVGESLHFLPADYGVYRAFSNPSAEDCVESLRKRILSPYHEVAVKNEDAPEVSLGEGQTGNASDLETRIDVAPDQPENASTKAPIEDPLLDVVRKANLQALLVIESSRKSADGVLLNISSGVIIAGSADWDGASTRNVLQQVLSTGLSTAHLGTNWQEVKSMAGVYQLDGLSRMTMAVRGRFLVVANEPSLALALLQAADQSKAAPDEKSAHLTYSANFNHAREQQNFHDLTDVLDTKPGGSSDSREPDFFSSNIGSLSHMFSGVASESMEVREADGRVQQTVIYRWAQ